MAGNGAETTYELVETGLDYLTATCKSQEAKDAINPILRDIHRQLQQQGHKPTEFHWKGYHGVQIGGFTYAGRPDSLLVRLSGPLADRYWPAVLPYAEKLTRIDLQATYRLSGTIPDVATTVLADFDAYQVRTGRQLASRLVDDRKGGKTAYLGSRTSELMGRVYNKEKESKDDEYYKGCWRWELEVKGDACERYRTALRTGVYPASAFRLLAAYYAKRRICFPARIDVESLPRPHRTPEPPHAKQLRWFRTCIAPVIRSISTQVSRETILDALGLLQGPTGRLVYE